MNAHTPHLQADAGEIERFVGALFTYASGGSRVSLRAFYDDQDQLFGIEDVTLNGEDLVPLAAAAARFATRAAATARPVVFCPPIATFGEGRGAKESDLAEGLALSVELDDAPVAARVRLEQMLGPATVVVASGGEWADPETSEIEPRLHLHWRLSEPTGGAEEHGKLKEVRRLVTALAGGDASGVPLVHPLRWPGTWHRKGAPRLAKIVELNESAELELDEALGLLQEAAAARGLKASQAAHSTNGSDPDSLRANNLIRLMVALDRIANNDRPWEEWNRIGMALWAATGGSEAGREAFHAWSSRSEKYDQATTEARWRHYRTSPPTRIGAGTLFHMADEELWAGFGRGGGTMNGVDVGKMFDAPRDENASGSIDAGAEASGGANRTGGDKGTDDPKQTYDPGASEAHGDEPNDSTETPAAAEGSFDFEAALVRNRSGHPRWCAENAGLILEYHPEWVGTLAYDEFAAEVLLLKPIPGSKTPRSSFRPRELRGQDITAALRWFNRHGFPDATQTTMADALIATAHQSIISPVRHYLEALVWDGRPRIEAWLIAYCGAADTTFARAVGQAWLISAVARLLEPGCKADCALILEGPQGVGKSTALRILAGADWFSDALHDLRHKDASQGLRAKWIIELPELAAMRRTDVEQTKAFLSRDAERYRPSYGRGEVVEPRRCVFAGTTNRTDYLIDDTGNRRFWPVAVGTIDREALARDRDQIWAEAVHAYRSGTPWWLSDEDEVEAARETALRTEDDPWTAKVLLWALGLKEVSTKDILVDALEIDEGATTKADAMRVAGILQRHGWRRDGKFTYGPNRRLTRYVPDGAPG